MTRQSRSALSTPHVTRRTVAKAVSALCGWSLLTNTNVSATANEPSGSPVAGGGSRLKFFIAMVNDESAMADGPMSEADMAAMMQPYLDFQSWCADNDVTILAGEGLMPSPTVRTVHPSSNGSTVSDGPFLPRKEQLGGFYLIECASEDIALEAAKQCPLNAANELWPVMMYE